MADYNGVNSAKKVSVPPDMIAAKFLSGKKRVSVDWYEATGEAVGSRFVLGKLPKGAILLPNSCLLTDALGAGRTLAIGDGTTADKFLAATAVNTANLNTPLTGIDNFGVELAADTTFYATVGGDVPTGTIKLVLFYVVE